MKTLAYLGVAHIHTPGFVQRLNQRSSQFKVKAVWDEQPARAKITARKLNSQTIDHVDAVFGDNDIDAVIIASETRAHQDLVERAAAAGKHMFVEKPLGMKAADAYAMQKAIDAAGVIFQTGHFMRGYPHYRFIKSLLETGSLGAVARIRHSNVHQGAARGTFDVGQGWFEQGWMWMTDLEQAGVGGFGDLGAHSLDIMMWLMGDVARVTAQLDNLLGKYPCDEYGEGLMRFANGAVGALAAGWVDVLRPMPILVSGAEGAVYVNDDKLYLQSDHIDGADGGEWTDLPDALPHAFDLFLDALLGKTVPLVSAKEAADRTAVMEAFYLAAETNSWVQPQTS